MWYQILVENEFADYFMNNEAFSSDFKEEKRQAQMLKGYADIVSGVTYAWNYLELQENDSFREEIEKLGSDIYRAFESCRSQLHLTATKSLSCVWKSIPEFDYNTDISFLNAEQIAVLIMYPFWSRMGGSYEDDFQKSGQLKKYLCALKNKCAK